MPRAGRGASRARREALKPAPHADNRIKLTQNHVAEAICGPAAESPSQCTVKSVWKMRCARCEA
jgi:hypothetical protein